MLYAWILYGVYYAGASAWTLWALAKGLGAENLAIVICGATSVQICRVVPSGGLIGLPGDAVRWLNYHVLLTAYRMNYLYTLALGICAALGPLVALAVALHGFTGLDYDLIAAKLAALVVWIIWVRRRKDKSLAKEFPAYPGGGKRVAVVGGGCAGIVACKEMLDEGHTVVGFESSTVLGGVWSAGDYTSKRTTGSTLSSSSRSNSFFGDYPMPSAVDVGPDGEKNVHPTHYTEADFREYLLSYAADFGVDKHFRLGTSVSAAVKNPDGGYLVTSVGPDGRERKETFDFLVVATGLNQTCSGLQLGPDGGGASHTCSIRGNGAFEGKKVVVVGLGESSSDATSDIANVASEVHVVVRSPVLLLPRNTFGTDIAPDHKLSRLVLSCPQFIRTWKLMSQTAVHGPMNLIATKLLGLKGRFGNDLEDMDEDRAGDRFEDNWSYDWWKLFMKLGPLHPKASWGVTRGQVTKTAPLVKNFRQGNIKFHTADICDSETVASKAGAGLRAVTLTDGTRIENVHRIVNATGYKTVWPFLASEGVAEHCTKDRYRLVFHPKLPNCAFVGFCRGGVGSIMQGIEMQSRWAALVCSGKRRLPAKEKMEELIAAHKTQMVGKFTTKITNIYCNALARHEVGCEPDGWEVFKSSPKAWFYLMCGPFCMSMFRFRGPHACPKVATKVFEGRPQLVRPLEYGLQQGMEFLLGALCRFWTSVSPVHLAFRHHSVYYVTGNEPQMRHAWVLFGVYYATTSARILWALTEALGTDNLVIVVCAAGGFQLFRALPSEGLIGLPGEAVRWLNYHVLLTAYRMNYLCTLAIAICVALAPLVALASTLHVHTGLGYVLIAAKLAALVVWTVWTRARKDRSLANEFPAHPGGGKRVAVVGGGCAGIVACKEMLDEGHTVVGFESSTVLGGVWSAGDYTSKRTTGNTLSSSSRSNSFFGDYPMPSAVDVGPDGEKNVHPTHYTEADFREYLLSYADNFSVDRHFRLGTSVSATRKTPDGGYLVTSVGPDGRECKETFDFLVVATGLNQTCSGLQLGLDGGGASHTCSIRGNGAFEGKKVVVVGLGESSSDATSDIANVASEVHVVVRSPVLLLPRNTFGTDIAPDHKLSRLVLMCPQFVRTWKLMSQTAVHGPMNLIATKLLGLKGRFGTDLEDMDEDRAGDRFEDNWSYDWWKLFMKLGPLHPKASWGVTRGQVTKTAPLVKNFRQGNVKFHTADIRESETNFPKTERRTTAPPEIGLRTVTLTDGTRIENVHLIVNATGYRTVWPFLASEGVAEHCTKDRYRLVFHPKLPNCAFVGFCRGGVGSIMQGIEMQSRWAALVCSGKRRLPAKEKMEELIAAHKTQMVGKFTTKITNIYCNALARHEVGCEPDGWEAKALALVDCVQDTYSNVAALIDDSVYNMEGGMEEDLEKMMIDLTRVDRRVTTIVAGVRSLSMTFKAHAVSAIKCVCTSLRFRRFSNEGGAVDLAPAWHRRVVSSTRMFGVQHQTRLDQQNNVVVLFVLSRPNAAGPWTVTSIYDELRCRDTTALKHLMSGYVASPAVSSALPQMKEKFFAMGNSRGLKRHPFVHAVFMHLYQTTKGLHVKADAARVVAMLDELFDQIDINGNDYVDWEEFTSFCIELGIISGKGTNNGDFQPDDFIIDYQPVSVAGVFMSGGNGGGGGSGRRGEVRARTPSSTTVLRTQDCGHGPGVTFMTYVPELQQIYYAERGSNILKALDSTGKPHHQYEFLDPYFVEGQPVTVHSVAHVPGRYLAVFCSDHSVNLMKEVKNRRGSTHGYHCEAKVMHQLMHRKLTWEPCFQTLISINDIAAGAQRIYLRPEHANTITDIVCIAEKELVVTGALDRRVCVWQMPTWKLRATFRDHSLGVQALSYLRGTLLSASFDWEIIAWDAERLEKIGTMTGHKAPVTAIAQMVCPTNYEDMKAISADCNFEVRIWDLSGCIAGGNTIPCLMFFRLPHVAGNVQGPKHIFLPFDSELSVQGYSNMLIASQGIASYAARKIKKEFFVPPAAEYNVSSAHFLSALRQNVHIWDATSGEYVRKLLNVSPSADITSACFALPFERRLILGTEDGKLLLVNYVTGAILDEMTPHTAEVTQMVYCKATKIIISADYHGNVVVTSEIQCKLKEIRKLKGVHGPGVPITGMAYSHRLSKIVTCSGNAELQVLEFQDLDHVAAAVQSAGEPSTGVAFLDQYSIIVLGDLTRVCLWHLDMENFRMACFVKLSVPAVALGLPMDVLSSVGVLRLERPTAKANAAKKQPQNGHTVDPMAGGDGGDKDAPIDGDEPQGKRPPVPSVAAANDDGGDDAGKQAGRGAYDEGEVWVALGTEGGRMAAWALGDVLESDATLMPHLRLRPVPDCLCPGLRSSFNPYCEKVETGKKKAAQAHVPTDISYGAAGGKTGANRATAGRTSGTLGSSVPGASLAVAKGPTAVRVVPAVGKQNNTNKAENGSLTGGPGKPSSGDGGGIPVGGEGAILSATASRVLGDGGKGVGAGNSTVGSNRSGTGDSIDPAYTEGVGDTAEKSISRAGFANPQPNDGRDRTAGGTSSTAAEMAEEICVKPLETPSTGGDISFDQEEEDCTGCIPEAVAPKAVWQGHTGPVARIGSCGQPPCFFSLGEMTAGLLEEVEKRRAQMTSRIATSRIATSRDTPEFAKVVEAAAAANKAEVHALTSGVGVATSAFSSSERPPFDERTAADVEAAAVPGSAPALDIAIDVDSHPPGAVPIKKSSESGSIKGVELGAADQTLSGGEGRVKIAQTGGEAAAAAAKRRVEAERRQAALATIEHRSHRQKTSAASAASAAAAAAAAVATGGSATLPPGGKHCGTQEVGIATKSETISITQTDSCTTRYMGVTASGMPSFSMSTAFSKQSVRSGETLGYYGREEIRVLSAISKNPTRIAAYNRITEGKGNKEDGPIPKIIAVSVPSRPRRRPRTTGGVMQSSASAPALQLGPRETEATAPPGSASTATGASFASESRLSTTTSRGKGEAIERRETNAWDEPHTSRTVKMYRNAAREYGKGCSAGQAMWKELQHDPSAARTGSCSTRSIRGRSTAGRPASVAVDGSTLTLELPQIEHTSVSKASWAGRDRPEDSEDESEDEEGFNNEWDDGGGGNLGNAHRRGATCIRGHSPANDWFAATRHGRDDTVLGSIQFSFNKGPGWEDTFAFKRSTARRAILTSRILAGKRPRWASAAPSHEKWDWDWCTRPVSALPADRVESLLTKFDEACAGGQGRSSSELKRESTYRPTASTARPEAVTVAESERVTGFGSPAAAAAVEGPATEANLGKRVATTLEGAAREAATGETPLPAGPYTKEQEPSDSLAVAGEADSPKSPRAGRGKREMARQKSKTASTGRKSEEAPGEGRREATLVPKDSVRNLNASRDRTGKGHLVSMEVQKRNKELVKLQQKIIALLVKGNDHARRRDARDRRRGQKVAKKPLAKGPRPGQLGPHYTFQSVMDFRAAFNFVDEDMSGCLDSEEWRRFLDRFKSTVAVVNMRSMFLHLDKDMSGSVEVGELVPVIFNKASSPQHHLIRHLIEYENSLDVKRFTTKILPASSTTLQLDDAKRLFELHDTSGSGRLDQKTVRKMLLSLRVPQLSWDAFARSAPLLQTSQSITADEFAAGFFEAFVL
eukprot:g15449.t1